jgi:hypothetical protein
VKALRVTKSAMKTKAMKPIRILAALTLVIALLAGPTLAVAETCCEKAAAQGKDCTRKCCIAAHKEGKSCEKCNPKKEDLKFIKKKEEKKQAGPGST